MAHVMIPAREDVDAGAIHHSGTNSQSFSLKGEGCDVEKVNSSSFVIKVTQPSFDAFGAITDLTPVWDELEAHATGLDEVEKQSKALRQSVTDLQDALALYRKRVSELETGAGRLLIDLDGITANQFQARQKQYYLIVAMCFALVFSFFAAGLALWTLKA